MTTGNRSYQELPSGGDPSRRVLNETTAHLSHPTPNAKQVTVIGQCPTECSYDDGTVNFVVRCLLDAGHGGRHRGTAVIEFALVFVAHQQVWDES